MSQDLSAIAQQQLTGNESLRLGQVPLEGTILEFWRWAASDLVGNTFRGWFAEYLVARALGIHEQVRKDWLPYDLEYGGVKIEVKCSAYIQSWHQNRLSIPRFSIKRARAWDPDTNALSEDLARRSDVYVFCLQRHREQASLDSLDLEQWCFYVVPTSLIDARLGNQQSVGVGTLEGLGANPTEYLGLKATIDQIASVDAA